MNHGSPVRFAASREMNLQSQILNQLDSSPILLLGSFCRELFAYQVRTSYLYIAIPVSGETRRKKKKDLFWAAWSRREAVNRKSTCFWLLLLHNRE